jgi:hypothetical protein
VGDRPWFDLRAGLSDNEMSGLVTPMTQRLINSTESTEEIVTELDISHLAIEDDKPVISSLAFVG